MLSKNGFFKMFKVPKSIFFILGNEFCERFSFYGMAAILPIYLTTILGKTEDESTEIIHAFYFFVNFSPILGAWLADRYLGKFKTIVSISMIYILGHVLKTIAAVSTLNISHFALSLTGLFIIALATGGIKPCVSSFGGDQFKLPEQEEQLTTYFSMFYFSINIGALLSTFITPILRSDVHCFNEDSCFPLAFGVPAVLMAVATILIVIGKPLYVMNPPEGSIVGQTFGIIWFALMDRIKSNIRPDHWLDAAKKKYDAEIVDNVKILLRLFTLYLPLPFFWALFKQQGSRWIFQAKAMNGQLGSYTIRPDQTAVINPLLVICFIPIFVSFVYPLFTKFNFLAKPLHRMTAGGILAAIAFFTSGILETQLQKTHAQVPDTGKSHLHLMNTLDCPILAKLNLSNFDETFHVYANHNQIIKELQFGQEYVLNINVELENCSTTKDYSDGEQTLVFKPNDAKVVGISVISTSNGYTLYQNKIFENPKKSDNADPKFRIVFDLKSNENQTILLVPHSLKSRNVTIQSNITDNNIAESDYHTGDSGMYNVFYVDPESKETKAVGSVELLQGGVYTCFISQADNASLETTCFKLTEENSIHMLWVVPQIILITIGEVFFSVTGLEFSYTQAPSSMKSVVQAAWYLTIAFGNIIIIIVKNAKSNSLDQASEFFIFGGLMIVDMIIFALMAYRYTKINKARTMNLN